MALGHLDHKEDFPFLSCVRLRIYDVKTQKTLLAAVLGCNEISLFTFKLCSTKWEKKQQPKYKKNSC